MLKSLYRDWLPDCGLLLIRIILGMIFVFHGCQKLFGLWNGSGLDGFAAYLATLEIPLPAVSVLTGPGRLSANAWLMRPKRMVVGTSGMEV